MSNNDSPQRTSLQANERPKYRAHFRATVSHHVSLVIHYPMIWLVTLLEHAPMLSA